MTSDSGAVDVARFDPAMATQGNIEGDLRWFEPGAAPLELSGFAWFSSDGVYRRLPVTPPEKLPDSVESLANCTAGGTIRLRTDSQTVVLRVELRGPAQMVHMAPTGEAGFDLYVGAPGEERFAGVTKFDRHQDTYEVPVFSGSRKWRDLTINFPLYKGVHRVTLGLARDAEVSAPTSRVAEPPLLFYGSSITQGGCAARPGMAYPAILSRRLQRECLNLGFSGSGKGEPEVARALATIDACRLFVLDYDANCPSADHLRQTLPVFVDILRAQHPKTPILVVSRVPTAGEYDSPGGDAGRLERLRAQQEAVEAMQAAGVSDIQFLAGSDLLGEEHDECTVDGSHPTDLGFLRMADGMEPVLRRILGD
ncbi:MAG: hypothetical protein HOH74_19980 [Gemmatimonadetes bacterium]|nr:hypothetical protein [Gemmatimonadota bacterium]